MQTSKTFKVLAFLCFSFILSNTQAQIDSFKLSDYKLADYKRQGININLDLAGSSSSRIETYSQDVNKSKFFSNKSSGNYFLDINNRKYQGNHGINLSNDIRYLNEDYGYKRKETDILSEVSIFSTNNFYGKKDYYFSLNINGTIYSEDRINQWETDSSEFHNTRNWVSSGIGFGKGRIEIVTDARHALYILNELKKSNRLKREPTHDEIYKLSEHITKALNKRVLDSRLKKIYELTVIDSVLLDMDLIETTDMVYFSNLNDMWDFGGNQYRTSGFRMKLTYNPTYQFVIENEINSPDIEMNTNSNSFIHNLVYSIDWNNPFKQKLQSNLSFYLIYFIDSNNGFQENGLRSSIDYRFGIYPNTRTSLFLGTSIWSKKSWEIEADPEIEYFEYGFRPYFQMHYYFSPKLSLNVDLSLHFDHVEDYSNIDYWNNNIAIGLVYSIF